MCSIFMFHKKPLLLSMVIALEGRALLHMWCGCFADSVVCKNPNGSEVSRELCKMPSMHQQVGAQFKVSISWLAQSKVFQWHRQEFLIIEGAHSV